ncbi:Interactor with SLO-1 [Caenorhabditis elegans]|uniref:Interactor with SLO-1 n=1 Tax=Caenorhabditis elegans TaxID=6239 RepID=O44513_CAEEL|nr:Interactor with SLO-1 [Caenorhabditis elegans]CCD61413.1 Interactor with SLO-1 [Caenorhabditis elegans]|eukprot:NP_501362.2 Interactor with SLO-1 [Caenorhabditis elegans]
MMGSKRGRGAAPSNQERVRTHLFFGSKAERPHQKRKRRAQNKLHVTAKDKKDEMVQAGASEIDPQQWTGNQRVLHFGPMAQRDPYFYYYPKGWDILYPATFGFFPYRTSKFRGSSSLICCTAFGVFLLIGGLLMSLLGYKYLYTSPFWTWPYEQRIRPPPIQIAGPILFGLGCSFLIISLIYFLCTTKLCDLSLHHTKKHNDPARLTTITTHYVPLPPIFEKDPYQPLPPPAYPVLENRHAMSNVVKPHDEKKLYPPVIPGCSTLSLHRRSPNNIFVASPYNTLRATSVGRYQSGFLDTNSIMENRLGSRQPSVASRRQSSEASSQKRSKSMGPLHRTNSNRSKGSGRSRRRENSQI